MNTQTFANHSKQIFVAFLTVAAVGAIAAPVRADDALIQESIQESVVTGEDNVSVQNSNQSNNQYTEYRERGRYSRHNYDKGERGGSTGIVQRSDQYCDQVGAANTCVQDAQQSNNSTTRRRRSSRY